FILRNAPIVREPLLTPPFDYTVLTHLSGPTSSDSLEDRLRKAKSFNVASSIPSNSSVLCSVWIKIICWLISTKPYNEEQA
ncbi:MAG: hypothetical protein U9Q97_07370, partial [Acidobacteriota bacterium]|nr:hypothetical protein [Acidobacteriota bacterium]